MYRSRALHFVRQLSPGLSVAPRRGFQAATWRLEAATSLGDGQDIATSVSPGHSQEPDDQNSPSSEKSRSVKKSEDAKDRIGPQWDPSEIETEIAKGETLFINRGKIAVKDKAGRFVHFHFWQLRDDCKCPQCVDPHSKQRLFRTSDIPMTVRPRHVKWDGKQMQVLWKNDIPGYGGLHKSNWSVEELHKPHSPFYSLHRGRKWSKNLDWGTGIMKNNQHWISYQDYMGNEEKFAVAMRALSRMGLIFVKDIPQSREMVEKLATRIGPLRNTFYGSTWDVRSMPEAKNVAYTNQDLGFHMDLLYMKEPPGYQLLHCLENSCEGGESRFSDAFRAARLMARENPFLYDVLTKRALTYEYTHDDQLYYNRWPVFDLHPDRGSGTSIRHVNYSPPFQSKLPLTRAFHDNENFGEFDLLTRALRKFLRYVEHPSHVFELKLNPGECVIFENRRVLHARRQFNTGTGKRWLAGAYIDEDAALSRFNVCRKNHMALWHTEDPLMKHVKWLNRGSKEREGQEAEPETAEQTEAADQESETAEQIETTNHRA